VFEKRYSDVWESLYVQCDDNTTIDDNDNDEPTSTSTTTTSTTATTTSTSK